MDNSVNFARRFAHLLWLLLHEPQNIDEQKGTLRALAAQCKEGAFHLGVHPTGLTANDQPVPSAFTGAMDLLIRMEQHGLVLISTMPSATPADLLAVARILAADAVQGDNGAAAEAKRVAARVGTVRFATRPRISNEIPRETPRATTAIPIDMDFGEIYDDPYAEAMAKATPRSTTAIKTPSQSHDAGGLFAQFAASSLPTEPYPELIKKLDAASDVGAIDRILEGLVALGERATTEGRAQEVTDILHGITTREQSADHEAKRAIGMAYRRLAKPSALRAVAMQMANSMESRKEAVTVLTRAGEEGADALIELFSDPGQQRNRRLFFDVLVKLKAGKPALMHMLSDPRWFAVRSAAEILGEMQVRDAEQPLTELLLHNDDRVRRAANGALMRMGTPRAMQTILEALSNSDPELRIEAASALGTRRDQQAVPTLLKALDTERDESVQPVLMQALGKQGTADALKRLIALAAPERRPFMRKATSLRVSAVHGLVEAKGPEALDALRALQSDKEADVASAATFGLRRISRDAKVSEP